MTEHAEVAPEIVARLHAICRALPETVEEAAWVGTRWTIRKKNFAEVADIVGMTLDTGADWDEVAELVTESYCVLAPRKLSQLVNRVIDD